LFFRDGMAHVRQLYNLEYTAYTVNLNLPKTPYRIEDDVSNILVDVFDVCILFNDPDKRFFEVDLVSYHEVVISLTYRLLALDYIHRRPLVPSSEAVYQLGLLTFIMILFLQYGRRRLYRFSMITKLLKIVLKLHSLQSDKDHMLWLMIMGSIWMMDGVWTLEEHSGEWLPPLMLELIDEMGLQSWGAARSCIIKYPWIYKLHDEPGMKIWERVQESRKSG
jgi:hypothetical protein